jgi:hypothetical protein
LTGSIPGRNLGDMLSAHDESRFFDSCKPQLLERYAGQFAVVCGRKLIGVHPSLEQALKAAAEAFGDGLLEDGAPILISEIADEAKLRVVAEPRPARP